MEKKFKLKMIPMPNFINYEVPARPKQEGLKVDGNCIPVQELTKEEAEEYSEWMKQSFINHWKIKSTVEKESSQRTGETNFS